MVTSCMLNVKCYTKVTQGKHYKAFATIIWLCVCVWVIWELYSLPLFFSWISTLLSLGDCWCLASRAQSPGAVSQSCACEVTFLCLWLSHASVHHAGTHTFGITHTVPCDVSNWQTSCVAHFNGPMETQTTAFTHMNHRTLPCPHDTHMHIHTEGHIASISISRGFS